MKLLKYLIKKKQKNKIKALPKIERSAARFKSVYPNYEIGYGSYGLPLVHDWDEGTTLKIGSFCSIAGNVNIFLGGHHRTDWLTTFPFPAFLSSASQITDYDVSRGDVVIGNDVWLCTGSIILSGVKIGHGAVVAAGAVVVKDVEPYSIVAGNPAKHVRYRFSQRERNILLNLAWWSWSEELIVKAVPLLCSNDIVGLVNFAERYDLYYQE